MLDDGNNNEYFIPMTLDYFNNIIENFQFMNISLTSAVSRFILAGVLGTLSSFIYRLYTRKENFIHDLQQSLIFLSLIICSSMMIIGNNLASAFGLVGAVSIIRFRTSVKSSRDMAFVLFNITIGMGCGLGFLSLSILSFAFIGTSMVILYFVSNRFKSRNHISDFVETFRLDISYLGNLVADEIFEDVFTKYGCKYKIYALSSSSGKIKYSYNLSTDNKNNLTKIIYDLTELESLNSVKVKCTLLETNNG